MAVDCVLFAELAVGARARSSPDVTVGNGLLFFSIFIMTSLSNADTIHYRQLNTKL
ncbi:hypothetical protein NTGHW29_70049 [Candidatus Nitrotoga sp. HW29]|nr:hypothetical protein NTGHW29_70049 [Candidatus Nitrotoga sp. HW29]